MKKTRLIVAGALALTLALGVTGMAFAASGYGWFGMHPTSNTTGYNGMTGNGNNNRGGYGGMMGNGNGGMMGGGYGWVTPQGTPAVSVTQVDMTNNDSFSPAIIQVAMGTTVTWTNTDTDTHTVTFMPMMSGGSSGDVVAGATFSRTFTNAGTYYYRCMYHAGMVGEVIVTG